MKRLRRYLDGKKVSGHKLHVAPRRGALGGKNILFTAPHSILLCRDGQEDHVVETHTRVIAHAWGARAGGGSVSWSREEVKRVQDRGAPDPANRDPNYLLDSELKSNVWHLAHCAVLDPSRPALHVDIHGMTRTNHGGRDAVLSLEAVREHAPRMALIAELKQRLSVVLRGFRVDFGYRQLTGVWGRGRNTQTQMSTKLLGVRYAIQLEMSLELRKAIAESTDLCNAMADAFVAAWRAAIATTRS